MTAWRLPLPKRRFVLNRRSTAPKQFVESPSAQLQEFLVNLGGALISTGTAATDISRTLKRVAVSLGSPNAAIVVMPTVIFVGIPGEEEMRFDIAVASGGEVLFDKAARVYSLVERATTGTVNASDGMAELAQIAATKPRFRPYARVFGHGLAAAGVGLVLIGSSPMDLFYSFVLGMLVGIVKILVRPGSYTAVLLPVLAAFVLSVVAFAGGKYGFTGEPIQVLIPPLVTLLPGGILTTGIQELAAGDMVAGSSRLVYGIAQLIFLVFGIVAALTVTEVPASTALLSTHARLGEYGPWIGVLLLSVGFFLYYCGPRHSLYYLTAVLIVAYGGQLLGGFLLGGIFSGFVGALALTVVAYLAQSLPGAPPAVVCFLPAFWLLVPGATGLIGLTQSAAGFGLNGSNLIAVVGSIVAIALGVLTGTAIFRQIFRIAPTRWGLRLV
jgi:uncharacterized membrane protein YjjP (DUF1212 family)